jgi:hypothetical protein
MVDEDFTSFLADEGGCLVDGKQSSGGGDCLAAAALREATPPQETEARQSNRDAAGGER